MKYVSQFFILLILLFFQLNSNAKPSSSHLVNDSICNMELVLDDAGCIYEDIFIANQLYCSDTLVVYECSFYALYSGPNVSYSYLLNSEYVATSSYSSDADQSFIIEIKDPVFGEEQTIEIIDDYDDSCYLTGVFSIEPCSACALSDLSADVLDCEEGMFSVGVDFEHNMSLTDSFLIQGLPGLSNIFSYADLPLVLGPFAGLGDQIFEVFAQDLENADCTSEEFLFGPVNCSVEMHEVCIDFEDMDTLPDFPYAYNDTLFEENGVLLKTLNAYYSIYYPYLDHNYVDGKCYIAEFGSFVVDFSNFDLGEFHSVRLNSSTHNYSTFNLVINETDSLLNFLISEVSDSSLLDVEIEVVSEVVYDSPSGNDYDMEGGMLNFNGDIESLEIFSNGNFQIDDVCYSYCTPLSCSISNIEYQAEACTDESFNLVVDFSYQGVSSAGFVIGESSLNYSDTFSFADLPILIEGVSVQDEYNFVIEALDVDEACFELLSFETPDCLDACFIDISSYQIIDCDKVDSTFFVELYLDYENLSGESVQLYGSGYEWGLFDPSVQPLIIGPFDLGSGLYELIVEDVLLTDCLSSVEFSDPDCNDFVWPGDANSDNIANNIDLLYIGLANGFEGLERADMGIFWESYNSFNWSLEFPESGVNFKHADSDGNGQVEEQDIEAILANYNLIHGTYTPTFTAGDLDDPPLFIELPLTAEPGELINADVELGTEDLKLDNLYGIAFTIEYPEGVFVDDDVQFVPEEDSWLGTLQEDLYSIDTTLNGLFEVEVAFVRNDQNNAQENYGRIGNFIGVIDDILGLAHIKIKDVRALSNYETEVPIQLIEQCILISDTNGVDAKYFFNVYPVPTKDYLNIQTNLGDDIQFMEIIRSDGSLIETFNGFNSRLDLETYKDGVYFIRVVSDMGIYQSKFTVIN